MRILIGHRGGTPQVPRRLSPWDVIKRTHAGIAALAMALALTGCHKDTSEKEPEVPVQVVAVQKTPLQRTVTAEGILFPLQQAAIMPKISAPVKAFYVKRGAGVRQGQLLATLENRDLAAAAQDTKGSYEQAQATYTTTTAAGIPEELQKAGLDLQAAKALLAAQEKIYSSRQELFQQGAMPRKELDQAGVMSPTGAIGTLNRAYLQGGKSPRCAFDTNMYEQRVRDCRKSKKNLPLCFDVLLGEIPAANPILNRN